MDITSAENAFITQKESAMATRVVREWTAANGSKLRLVAIGNNNECHMYEVELMRSDAMGDTSWRPVVLCHSSNFDDGREVRFELASQIEALTLLVY